MRDVGKSIGNAVLGRIGRVMARAQQKRSLPVDLLESDTAYLAVFDTPGAHSSDIQARFDDRTIAVQLDRFRDQRDEFELFFPGRGMALEGEVSLPADAAVDPAGATATLKDNGTLHVRMPKTEPHEKTEDTASESQSE